MWVWGIFGGHCRRASTWGRASPWRVVGAAAMGVIGEKPELAGRALIFVGLAEVSPSTD